MGNDNLQFFFSHIKFFEKNYYFGVEHPQSSYYPIMYVINFFKKKFDNIFFYIKSRFYCNINISRTRTFLHCDWMTKIWLAVNQNV